MPSATLLTTSHKIHQNDIAVNITTPQPHVTQSSTILEQHSHDPFSSVKCCVSDSGTHHDAPTSPAISDSFIDPILLSQGQPHGIQQSSTTIDIQRPEICPPNLSETFTTSPPDFNASSELPRQPHFSELSQDMMIMPSPRNQITSGAVADIPRLVNYQTPATMSPGNVQVYPGGYAEIDYILGLDDLLDF